MEHLPTMKMEAHLPVQGMASREGKHTRVERSAMIVMTGLRRACMYSSEGVRGTSTRYAGFENIPGEDPP